MAPFFMVFFKEGFSYVNSSSLSYPFSYYYFLINRFFKDHYHSMNFLEHPFFDDPNLLILLGAAATVGLLLGWLVNAFFSARRRTELKTQLEYNFQQSQAYNQQQVLDLKTALQESLSENRTAQEQQASLQNKLGQLTQQVARVSALEQDSKRWQGHYQQIQQQFSSKKTRRSSNLVKQDSMRY